MKNLLIIFLFNLLLCLPIQGATLEFAFQLGEKQQPRLDVLLPDVARRLVFNKTGTKLIAKGMGGTIVEWDIQTRRKREISHMHAKRWFAYSTGENHLLVRKANDNVALLSLENGDETLLTSGQYESGSLSADNARLQCCQKVIAKLRFGNSPSKVQRR